MATLVLTTIGTALGGPIGGLIGAIAGQAVDQRVLAGKGREGARLSDLRVQTSSYASSIARVYGRMRVAGTVIWATDLIEQRQRQSAGKGQPKITTYSYSANFAVALSSRPIRSIGRIWAEGNLLRGAAGDFKQRVTMRLYHGDPNQAADPLIAGAEGVGAAPAYRDMAYVVFEDMDLAPFGNRIPSLTFEVDADDEGLTIHGVARDLIGDAAAGSDGQPITGYVASGATRGEAASSLNPLVATRRAASGPRWIVGDDSAPAILQGDTADDRGSPHAQILRGAIAQVPGQIMVNYFDPARDYQTAVQQARVAAGGRESESFAFPIAMQAPDARALTERLAMQQGMRAQAEEWPTGFAGLLAYPGQRIARAGEAAPMRVEERRIEGATVRLTLVPDQSQVLRAGIYLADPGRSVLAPDVLMGETRGALFDLPAPVGGDASQPRLILAAAGTGAAWRGASADLAATAQAARVPFGPVSAAAVLGHVVAVAGGPPTALITDRASSIDVQLVRDDMLLSNAAAADLLTGANLAAVGDEIIQFGHAEPIGPARWRLTDLLRGRFGTEDAILAAGTGQPFVLLDDPALLPVPAKAGLSIVGPTSVIRLRGATDVVDTAIVVTGHGRAQRPLGPVHCTARARTDGGIDLSWIRRSRAGFDWADGVDAPLDEPFERYRIEIAAGPNIFSYERDVAAFTITAGDIAVWSGTGASGAVVAIRQCGQSADSQPTMLPVMW